MSIGNFKENSDVKETDSKNRDVMRNDSNNADALYLRGLAMWYTGNIAGASKHINMALRLDPDNSTYRRDYKVTLPKLSIIYF